MSGNYWGRNNPFEPEIDEADYRAWTSCQQGACAAFELIPTNASGEPDRSIPYLQPITTEYDRHSGQLAILCYGTACSVFLQRRGLKALGKAINERGCEAIRVFDPEVHRPVDNEQPVITSMEVRRVE